jgi:hypothetical protein
MIRSNFSQILKKSLGPMLMQRPLFRFDPPRSRNFMYLKIWNVKESIQRLHHLQAIHPTAMTLSILNAYELVSTQDD